jgi:predicted ATPase
MLIEIAARHRFAFWESWGACLRGELLIRGGDFDKGCVLLRTGLESLGTKGFSLRNPEFLGALAEGLAGTGQLTESLSTIDSALAQSEYGGRRWCVAETLRIKGELLLRLAGDQSHSAAALCFDQALDVAREQGALLWELRCAMSLARLRVKQDRPHDARRVLVPAYDQFTEGFDTEDLRSAKRMLGSFEI